MPWDSYIQEQSWPDWGGHSIHAPGTGERAINRVPMTSQGDPSTVAASPAPNPAEKCRPTLSGMPACSSSILHSEYATCVGHGRQSCP